MTMLTSYAVWFYKKQLDLQCGLKHKWMNPRLHTLHLGSNSTSFFFHSPFFSVTTGQRVATSFHISQQEMLYRISTILLISLKMYLDGRPTGPFSILLAFSLTSVCVNNLPYRLSMSEEWDLFLILRAASCLLHGSHQCWLLWWQEDNTKWCQYN